MFGLGKKNKGAPAAESAEIKNTISTAENLNIPEENFIVMPEQYLPKGIAGSKSDKRLYLLIGGAALFLIILSAGLYLFFFSDRSPDEISQLTAPTVTSPSDNTVGTTTPEIATTTVEKIVTSQAFDSFNQLVGALKMTVPELVANKYGDSLGITVLAAEDVNIPTGSQIAGGIYSPYPLGVTFDEGIVFELEALALPSTEARASYYPAFLKGAAWEEISGLATTTLGWSFVLNKFPSGPLAAVQRSEVATTTPVEGGAKSVPSQDTDNDGLTDKEESLLGTALSAPDTDSDTYLDKAELLNNYNPLAKSQKLDATQLFSTYTNPTYGYKVSHPTKWLADALDQTNKQVLFVTDTEEFFEILIEENPLKKPIVDWYRSQSPTLANIQLDVTVVDGSGAVWSPDGLTLYVGKEGLVYIITYNKGTLEAVNWSTIFEYFYKSFKFGNTVSSGSSGSAPTSTPGSVVTPPPAPTTVPNPPAPNPS